MKSQIEVFGTLGTEESLPVETPTVTSSTEVRVYSGSLAKTNDTTNTSLIALGIVLCLIVFVTHKIKKLEEN